MLFRSTLIARDELGHIAQAQSAAPLARAEKQPLTTEKLRDQLGRLGGTPFQLGELRNHLEGEVILPVSELNRLRRDLVAELDRQRVLPKRWRMEQAQEEGLGSGVWRLGSQRSHPSPKPPPETPDAIPHPPSLLVLVRNLTQLDAALRCGVTTIYCDFEDPKRYREAVQVAREYHGREGRAGSPLPADGAHGVTRPTLFVAPPRITKSGEEWILKQVRSCDADGYLIRNYDHLNFFADCRRVGDFSLNVANPLTADYFMARFGLERLTASYDLNIAQLEALLRGAPPEWFEVTIHQHMPMFHMEHCVFCAFLSTGKDFHDCGRPCDRHDVRVRDRVGQEHPLKADAGCRNTVFKIGRAHV